jgi:CheY-like chemotaxis protein
MSQRILIVDDEFGLAEVVAEMLEERGYRTAVAINGHLALASIAEEVPDLVLLDCMMPIMDGQAVVLAIRADPALAGLPIVLMSALPNIVSSEIAEMTSGILRKPFSPSELFSALERALQP